MGLKPEFEVLRTQILNTVPLPSLFEAFATVVGGEGRRRILCPPLVIGHSPPISDQMVFAARLGLSPTFCAPSGSHPSSRAPWNPCSAGTHLYC